jgi:hypothetical protein
MSAPPLRWRTKAWLRAQVETKDGTRLPLYFCDPVRLQQDLEEEVKLGRSYFAEPGLVVLPEVPAEAIEATVQALNERGFFAHLQAHQADGQVGDQNGS